MWGSDVVGFTHMICMKPPEILVTVSLVPVVERLSSPPNSAVRLVLVLETAKSYLLKIWFVVFSALHRLPGVYALRDPSEAVQNASTRDRKWYASQASPRNTCTKLGCETRIPDGVFLALTLNIPDKDVNFGSSRLEFARFKPT